MEIQIYINIQEKCMLDIHFLFVQHARNYNEIEHLQRVSFLRIKTPRINLAFVLKFRAVNNKLSKFAFQIIMSVQTEWYFGAYISRWMID